MNPRAFPSLHSIDGNWNKEPRDEYLGMTLRDYFAAKAMLGYMGECYDMSPSERAKAAYGAADAMLKERGDA